MDRFGFLKVVAWLLVGLGAGFLAVGLLVTLHYRDLESDAYVAKAVLFGLGGWQVLMAAVIGIYVGEKGPVPHR